ELGDYLARGKQQDTDAEALLAYATCRESVELPGKRNLIEAIGILEHYRQLRPGDVAAAHTLLEWYQRGHDDADALALSNALLTNTPNDLEARSAKVKALWGLRRLPEALAESERLNRDAPTLLRGQLMTTYLLLAMDRGDEAVRRTGDLCVRHPNDAKFEMLRGAACMLAGQTPGARSWLAAAAARITADGEFALQQCRFLDAVGLFDNARELLARTAQANPTPAVVDQLLLRVYQDRGPAALLDTLHVLPAATESSEGRGLEAVSLLDLHRPIADIGAASANDAVARGWSIALAARSKGDLVAEASAYREALKRDPGNVIVADWLAEAEARMGESELALATWRSAAMACPNWAGPCDEMAATLEMVGRPEAALEAARAGAARAPGTFDAQLILAGAMVAMMPTPGPAPTDNPAMAMVTQLRTRWPNRPEVLPMYASALIRTGQTSAAARAIDDALQTNLPPSVLMGLADINAQAKLAFGAAIEAKLEEHASDAPAIAVAAARLCSPADASLLLNDTAAAAHNADPAAWDMAIEEASDRGDADALAAWEKIGDAYPKDVRVQSALVRNPIRFGDRAFWKRTIDRLHALIGEQGLTWRIEEARWILNDPTASDQTEKNTAEAVTRLQEVCRVAPDWADAHHLLGIALQRTGNTSGAIDELTAAATLAPADPAIVGDLSDALRKTGRTDEARAVVHRLASSPRLTPAARRWADQAMLADQLQSTIAARDLKSVESDCRRILASGPSPDAANDLAYALLLQGRSQDRPEALRLARLAVSLAPGRPEYHDTLAQIESASPTPRKIPAGP
ncbi:MAG TPA: tetratricopeptide repeat protein, partial [Tepidisphaeraceae bacterium]|nr:tetratricopeptide repeat protein [Tepidisphaeraceae bacterium]